MSSEQQTTGRSASRLIDERIRDLGDWRGETLSRVRAPILAAKPRIAEGWRWRGTPVWCDHGIVCTGETYRGVVKLTFARGAARPDPSHPFNAGLTGSTRRAIDIREGEEVDADSFTALVRAAVDENRRRSRRR